jgi:hypothetical protein
VRRLALLVAAAVLAACGTATLGAPDAWLQARLAARGLSVRSIDCVDSGLSFSGSPSYRCTVNFGDPHLVPYCVALADGRYVTDRERPELRCYTPEDEARYRAATT